MDKTKQEKVKRAIDKMSGVFAVGHIIKIIGLPYNGLSKGEHSYENRTGKIMEIYLQPSNNITFYNIKFKHNTRWFPESSITW